MHPSPSAECEHSGFFPGNGTFALSRLDGNPNFCLSRVADFEETEEPPKSKSGHEAGREIESASLRAKREKRVTVPLHNELRRELLENPAIGKAALFPIFGGKGTGGNHCMRGRFAAIMGQNQ